VIRFTVLGVPKPKGSLRAAKGTSGGVFVKEQLGDALHTWREQLSAAITPVARQIGEPITEPVAVFVTFRLPPPKTPKWFWPITRGRNDLDKLARTVLDHLSGVLLEDDSQVVVLSAIKTYSTIPGADVAVLEMTGLVDVDHAVAARQEMTAVLTDQLDEMLARSVGVG
jgi:Holliday junction resolvase RusA-like endonuclease